MSLKYLLRLMLPSLMAAMLCLHAPAQDGWEYRASTHLIPSTWAVTSVGSRFACAVGYRGNVLCSTDRGATWIHRWTGIGETLTAISFSDPATGTAVGFYGVILRTTDAGRTWERQTNGPFTSTVHFEDVAFVDRDHGVVVGKGGDLYRTADGGASWSAYSIPGVTSSLNAVSLRGNTAMAVGDFGIIVYSSDGGVTWTTRVSGGGSGLRDTWVMDSARALAVGQGVVLGTTNAGVTWDTLPGGETGDWTTIFFIDSLRGYTGSFNGKILRTTDGGLGWSLHASTPREIMDFTFFDPDTGIVTTGSDRPFTTNDGGVNWGNSVLFGVSFQGVSSIGDSAAIVVGQGGLIIRTTDAASSWTTLSGGTSLDLFGIDCLDPGNCTVVGDSGVILRTTDGGTTWVPQPSGSPQALRGVSLVTQNTAWIVGDSGTILRTTDGGANWAPRSSGVGYDLHDVSFADSLNGIIAGDSVARRTVTGGSSWQSIAPSPILQYRAVSYPTPTDGIVGGFYGPAGPPGHTAFIHSTTDQGQTWRFSSGVVSPGEILSLSAPDPAHLFAGGADGRIYRSINGGVYWLLQRTINGSLLRGISMFDSLHGFAVGDEETVHYTADGGVYIAPPFPSYPISGTTLGRPWPLIMTWQFYSSDVLSCRLQLSTEDAFQTGIILDTTLAGAPTALLAPVLAYSTSYYWRMKAETSRGYSRWSPAAFFITGGYTQYTVRSIQQPRNDGYLPIYLAYADSNQNSNPGYFWFQSTPVNPADTIRLIAVCAIPPGELRTGAAGGMVVYDTDTNLQSWRGIMAEIDSSGADGFTGIQPGDSLLLVGTVVETPHPSMNSTTLFRATSAQVLGSAAPPGAVPASVSDFYFNSYPQGLVRYSRGEQYEGMLVELYDLVVASAPDTSSGTLTMLDGAGNSISMLDASRWFTMRSHRDPASLYTPPAPGTHVSTIRGVITTLAGSGNDRGYCIAPVYPADMTYGAPRSGLIQGEIFEDVNNDSVRNGGDVRAGRRLVFLSGKASLTALTGTFGRFQFDRLDSGLYIVSTEERPGWVFTTPGTGTRAVALAESGASYGNDIGIYYRAGFIGGMVFDDRDGNGTRDPGEPGIPGREIRLTGGAIGSTVTDGAGMYRFDKLPNGSFTLETADQLFWYRTYPSSPSGQHVTLSTADQVADETDFGFSYRVKLRLRLNVRDNISLINKDIWWGIRPGATFGMWQADPGATLTDTLEGEFEIPPRSFAQIVRIFDARFQDPHYPVEEASPRFGEGGWTD
ncbi:MAG TPA: YCF48-related protein, partial [Bacteroidota bacterium]|nr:YCF48-related protein [Bacteroidota bacterium]